MNVLELERQYLFAINRYLNGTTNPDLLPYLVLQDRVTPRYWNCVDIERAKGNILWTSINPSERPIGPTANVRFNMKWEELSASDTYWCSLKQKVKNVIDICGHMDLLPLHIGIESNVHNILFTKDNSPEIQLAGTLLRSSQEMIESLHPRLIIHSNSSSDFLWGTKANKGIFWFGYILEEVSGFDELDCWRKGKGRRNLYQIKGICPESIKEEKNTKLHGTYLLVDYQVGTRMATKSITDKDVERLWSWVLKNQ